MKLFVKKVLKNVSTYIGNILNNNVSSKIFVRKIPGKAQNIWITHFMKKFSSAGYMWGRKI